MYCTSSQRGEPYALYCGTARTSGVCEGVYRIRQPVEDAVAVWLRSITREPKPDSKLIFRGAAEVEVRDLHEAQRRRLNKILETSQSKIRRLTDAYTDGVLELAESKVRREVLQAEREHARERLAVLDKPPAQAPAQAELTAIVDCWGQRQHRRAAPHGQRAAAQGHRAFGQERPDLPRVEQPGHHHLHQPRTCAAASSSGRRLRPPER